MANIPHRALENFGTAALEKLGLPKSDAKMASKMLVLSNLRGYDTHGIRLLAIYAPRIEAGGVAKEAKFEILNDAPACALVDGGAGLGQIVGTKAMNLAIEKARQVGTGFVAVKNSTHCAAAGNYSIIAADSDMIGVCFSNTFASMAAWGTAAWSIGNNPCSIAVPAGKYPSFVLDMATSITSWHKIYMAAERGDKIPPGMVLDPDGNPTDDPNKARGGTIMPFGGPKGSGMAIAIELLTGILTGGAFAKHIGALVKDYEIPEQICTTYIAIDIEKLMPIDLFKSRADQLIDEIKAAPKAEGFDEIVMPGEFEDRIVQDRQSNGIPLQQSSRDALKELGDKLGVPFEWA